MRHRALSLLGSLAVLFATLIGTDLDTTLAEATTAGIGSQQAEVHYVAADPLPTYTFVPPSSPTGQPIRLVVALHGMGGNGADMAAMLRSQVAQRGWALLAPTMPVRIWI